MQTSHHLGLQSYILTYQSFRMANWPLNVVSMTETNQFTNRQLADIIRQSVREKSSYTIILNVFELLAANWFGHG